MTQEEQTWRKAFEDELYRLFCEKFSEEIVERCAIKDIAENYDDDMMLENIDDPKYAAMEEFETMLHGA